MASVPVWRSRAAGQTGDLAEGDRVYVLRPVRVAVDDIPGLAPGDTGIVEAPGENFVAIRVRGVLVTVPRDDLVPAPSSEDRVP